MRIHVFLFIVVGLCFNSHAQESGLIGTFYGGWGRNVGNYIWTNGLGEHADFIRLADINGDGYEDAVSVTNGTWEIALSVVEENDAGNAFRKFGNHQIWTESFGNEASNVFLKDINNNQRADAIAFYKERNGQKGVWEVALSTGSEFQQAEVAIVGFGEGSDAQFFKDVTGNGNPDAITYNANDRSWYVRMNNGDDYSDPMLFGADMGIANAQIMMADVNGNLRSDVIYYKEGTAWVSLSTGTAFTTPTIWRTGFSGDRIMTGDMNGNGRADIIKFTFSDGRWVFSPSNGMNAFGNETFLCMEHGGHNPRASKQIPQGTDFMTGFVQSKKTESYGASPVVFNKNRGRFQVMPPLGMFSNARFQPGESPHWYNSYQQGTADQFLPLIDGRYYGFDANTDVSAIQYLIRKLVEADIDYVLFDQSNPWNALRASYLLFAKEIKKWNETPGNRNLKYAILGRYKSGPEQVEMSARDTYNDFLSNAEVGGAEHYQHWEGKPLLVCYGGVLQKPETWNAYTGSKTYGNMYTLRWMGGMADMDDIGNNDPGHWYGWLMPEGTIVSNEQMAVQPGYFNGNLFRSRHYDGIEADWYRVRHWDKVLRALPKKVTVLAFTGDPEQLNFYIHEADKAMDMGRTETWKTNDMYWNMTKDYIQTYRGLMTGALQHMADYGRTTVNNQEMRITFHQQFDEVPVVMTSLVSEATETTTRIRIKEVSETGFTIQLTDGFNQSDRINWIAVKPGMWKVNDMTITAGKQSHIPGSDALKVGFQKSFASAPVVFSELNSSFNALRSTCVQYDISADGFQLNGITENNTPLEREEIFGWIALEDNAYSIWSGRLFGSKMLRNDAGSKHVLIHVDDLFYDDLLMLSTSNNLSKQFNHGIIISSATDSSARINYQGGSVAVNDTIHTVFFDGAGGSLYGSFSDEVSTKMYPTKNDLFSVFPNPANGIFTVCLAETHSVGSSLLEIMNIEGKTVYSKSMDSHCEELNVNLNSGFYMLRITNETYSATRKLIISYP